jgi:hypothetical protein
LSPLLDRYLLLLLLPLLVRLSGALTLLDTLAALDAFKQNFQASALSR